MKTAILTLAGLAASAGAYAQTPSAEVCRKGADERIIEIASPGTVGTACDVVYIRKGGADVTVPYNANADRDFCRARAAELAATLIADGFECSPRVSPDLEAALAGGAPPNTGATAPLPVIAAAPTNAQAELATVAAVDAPVTDAPLNEQLERLDQPAALAAASLEIVGAPTQLATDVRPIEFRAPRPSGTTGAGRLVGPPPSLDGIVDETAAKPAVEPVKVAAAGIPVRPVADVVRGVLAASVAAWNEGNLDAYLGGYANTPDLVLVKNGATTTGFADVRKAYQQEVDATGGMGRLVFDGVDVTLTADDVATVVGRYVHSHAASTTAGVMTLVLKQSEGRWRIVTDTRVADATQPPPLAKN